MHTFGEATQEEVLKIIKSSNNASCLCDPIPTSLIRGDLLPVVLPVLTDIVNKSLLSGTFPSTLKTALVKPLLKKSSLDQQQMKNYRPVSNIPFLSKVIEKVVASRLASYMESNELNEKFQSAYKRAHCTETALLRVQNDVLWAIEKKSAVFLVLLDLSAAFDTVDSELLLSLMENSIGIKGTALNWFRSYLTERSQCVLVKNIMSETIDLLCGVPQGSVLGPVLFCLYTLPLGHIIRQHGLEFHIYADDTQLYLSFNCENAQSVLERMTSCISDIRSWMISQKLKINDDKTEFLILASPNMHSKLIGHSFSLPVGHCSITPTSAARSLGVIFDDKLSMDAHIKSVCKSTQYHLRNIGAIRHLLTDDAAAQLVHSLISSRLDYCNSLLCGLPDNAIQKLQRIQNNAARIVSRCAKHEHISPI